MEGEKKLESGNFALEIFNTKSAKPAAAGYGLVQIYC
jgi:hypothetical protein